MKVLCVDDDPFMLRFFEEAVLKLDLPGLEVFTAVSGMDALAIAGIKRIDFMILDNRLPDISGSEVLRTIKKSQPHVEVLMVTGHASVDTAVEAMKAGARDYIEKPIRLALLHEKMMNILELQRRGQEAEDFRYAKEAMEAGARRDITSLEDVLTSMKQCQERVMDIVESDSGDHEKVERIRQEISRFKNKE